MPPTRGRAAASAKASAGEGSKHAQTPAQAQVRIEPGELAPIVKRVLQDSEARKSAVHALREARMKELFRLVSIAQREYEDATGRMARWMGGEGGKEGEEEGEEVDEQKWDEWRKEHELVDGRASKPIELPRAPPVKAPQQPSGTPTASSTAPAPATAPQPKEPTPVPSSSPLSEPGHAGPRPSARAPMPPPPIIGAPPATLPKPVVDLQPTIVQSEDVQTDLFPPKIAVAPEAEAEAGAGDAQEVVPDSQEERRGTVSPAPTRGATSEVQPQTIDPALLTHQLPRYTATIGRDGIYVPRLDAAPTKRGGVEYHPSLYPPAGTGYLLRPPTPPGGDAGPLIGVTSGPLTPEDRTLLPLEGEYATELHPLPPAPPRQKRQRRERDRERESSAGPPAHTGPHLITSTSVQATIPPRTRTSRSPSPVSKDGLLPSHGDGSSTATGMAGVPVQVKHLDLYRLNASFAVNPVHRMLQRANKCVTSREWATAWAELKFMRAMERVETLKEENRWSFRQGKKFRGPVVPKSHWDYLLDEMRWMATDFREERKWKAAVAYELAQAVQEWHRAPLEGEGSKAELSVGGRAWGNGGITSMLGRPGPGPSSAAGGDEQRDQVEAEGTLHPALDEVMEDMERREQEEELAAELAVKEEEDLALQRQDTAIAAPPADTGGVSDEDDEDADGEVDDSMEIPQAGDVDMDAPPDVAEPAQPANGPSMAVVGSAANQTLVGDDQAVDPIDPALAKELRVPLVAAGPQTTTYDPASLGPAEPSLEELFPDLTAYAPPAPPSEDRIEQRIDQSTSWASRLTHTSRLMDVRPVLVSTLQPSKNRHNSGRWDHIDDGTMYDDTFDHEEWKQSSTGPVSHATAPIFGAKAKRHRHHDEKDKRDPGPPKPKQVEGRPALEWEENEDAALKELIDDYPRNWSLISDLFNSARITISTDERSPWDCYERWNIKFASPEERNPAIAPPTTANEDPKSAGPASALPGVSPAIASAQPTANGQTTPGVPNADQPPLSPGAARRDAKAARLAKFEGSKKKVRVMCLKEAMRRIQKRRDLTNKKPAQPRQVVQVHESHHPYLQQQNPPPTPQELSFQQHEGVKAAHQQMEQMRLAQIENQRRLHAQRVQQAQANAGRVQQMQQQAQTQVQQVTQLAQAAQMQQAQQAQQAQPQMPRLQQQNGATGSPQQANGVPMQAQGSQTNGAPAPPGQQAVPAQLRTLPPEFNLSNLSPAHQQQMLTMLNGPNRQAAITALQNARLPNGGMRPPANGQQQAQGVPQTNSPVQVQNMMQQMPLALQQQMAAAAAQNRGAAGSPATGQVNLANSPQLQQGQPMQRPQSAASQQRQSQSPQTANGRPLNQQTMNINGVQVSTALYAAFMASTQGNIANMSPEQKARAFQMLQQTAQAQAAAAQQSGQGGTPMPNPGTPVQMNGQQ